MLYLSNVELIEKFVNENGHAIDECENMHKIDNAVTIRNRRSNMTILSQVFEVILSVVFVGTLILTLLFLLSSISDSIRGMSKPRQHRSIELNVILSGQDESSSKLVKKRVESLLDQSLSKRSQLAESSEIILRCKQSL
jgi:hypothetical protein